MKGCDYCYCISFAKSDKAKFWNYILNKKLPQEFYIYSRKILSFDCNECHHVFMSSPMDIARGYWCPYCSKIKLCCVRSCKICFNNSFAINIKSKFWDNLKNKQKPWEVFPHTTTKYYFKCPKCSHSLYIDPNNLSTKEFRCYYCASNKLCEDASCKICFRKSFASSGMSIFWDHTRNFRYPRDVCLTTDTKYYFICFRCSNIHYSKLSNIANGFSCLICCEFVSAENFFKLYNVDKNSKLISSNKRKYPYYHF